MIAVGPPIGVIAFAYGLRDNEPGFCNRRLGEEVIRIRSELEAEGQEVVVGVQWEIALELSHYNWCVRPSLEHYLGSKRVVDDVKLNLFEKFGVITVVPVVQPLLQSIAVRGHLRRAGYTVESRKIRGIYHDLESLQIHTQSASELAWYALRQKLTGHEGKLIITDQMRQLRQAGMPPRSKP